MTKQILKQVADQIAEALPGIRRCYGLTHTTTLPGNTRSHLYPAVVVDGVTQVVFPDTDAPVIGFFQGLNTDSRSLSRSTVITEDLRFVVWGDTRALDTVDGCTHLAIEALKVMRGVDVEVECVSSPHFHTFRFGGEDDPAVFSAYSFDDARLQYKTHPYNAASILFRLTYVLSENCAPYVSPLNVDC